MTWRNTIKPQVRIAQNWRNTVRPEPVVIHGKDGKDGAKGPKGDKGVKGDRGLKGEDGLNGSRIFDNLESGSDGDFAIVGGLFYKKESDEWIQIFDARPKKTMVTGGVSEQYVSNFVNEAIAEIEVSSSGEVIRTTTSDYTITNETHLSCTVSSQKTVTLPATNTKTVTVKNSVSSSADIIIQANSSTLDGQSDWTIQPGNAFKFVPIGASAYDVV